MISGIFHSGSGLGNQLFRYVATRSIAEKKGCSFGMVHPELFKGTFITTDIPKALPTTHTFTEKKVVENGIDIRGYDPEINFIQDNTLIDGEFQDERYFNIEYVRKWLKTQPLYLPDDLCVIGFRGGEYVGVDELFLQKEYWETATQLIIDKYPKIRFEVHTDDPETARRFFDYPIIHDISLNWRSVRYAKHLIIANSSFYILPALMNEGVGEVIAPRYWARRNKKVWALPQNYYDKFTYI